MSLKARCATVDAHAASAAPRSMGNNAIVHHVVLEATARANGIASSPSAKWRQLLPMVMPKLGRSTSIDVEPSQRWEVTRRSGRRPCRRRRYRRYCRRYRHLRRCWPCSAAWLVLTPRARPRADAGGPSDS